MPSNSLQRFRNLLQIIFERQQGYDDGRMRLRVGKYRIIYRYDIDNQLKILYIIDIGSRGDIYK